MTWALVGYSPAFSEGTGFVGGSTTPSRATRPSRRGTGQRSRTCSSCGGGWLQAQGTLDFAGGIPVEMGSGFSALAAAMVVGARKDYGRMALLPHNSVHVLLGAGLLWLGWFGFNGGSGFSTGEASVLAFTNTLLAPAGTLVVWFLLDLVRGGRVTAIGAA